MKKIVSGWATTLEGERVPLSEDQANAFWQQAEESRARQEKEMPDTASAVGRLMDAWDRLRQLGWANGVYCPKDGSEFAVIEYGSTGIFYGSYFGDWPKGHVMVCDCSSDPSSLLWKALDKITDQEREKLEKTEADMRVLMEREYGLVGL